MKFSKSEGEIDLSRKTETEGIHIQKNVQEMLKISSSGRRKII